MLEKGKRVSEIMIHLKITTNSLLSAVAAQCSLLYK